jgi:hypothetical protein
MAYEELDISKSTTPEDIASKIETYYQQDLSDKLLRAQSWDEAIRFYDGDQHIEYNLSLSRFQQIRTSKNNDYIPRPTTNYILPNVKTIVSQLTKQRPQSQVRSNSKDPQDIGASKVSDLVLDVKHEELREEEKQMEKAYWGTICGTVFKKIFWDESTTKVLKVPKYKIIEQPIEQPIEQSLEQPLEENLTSEVAPSDGQPEGTSSAPQTQSVEVKDGFDEFPVGDVNSQVIPPFNIAIPLNTRSPLELDWIMEYSIQKIDWIKEQYGKSGNGFTGKANEVTEEKTLNAVLQLEYKLRSLVGRRTGGQSSGESMQLKDSAVLKEWYHKPTLKYPKGRMVAVANGKTLYDTPPEDGSPYYVDGFDDSWHPYVEWRFEIVPGRYWGKGGVEEQIPIQRRINSIDALIILNRRTMAIPQWLIPEGSGVPNGYISGKPGLNIPYRPVGANGAKPEKVPATPVSQDVFKEREQAVVDIKRVGMTQDVLEGINPTGVKTAYQLEQLQENALAMYGSVFQRWEKSYEREEIKKLLLISKRYKEPRPEFGKKLKAINKDITDIDLGMFMGSDLKDNVNVRVEVGSSIPRSKAGENALLREMVNGKILDVVGNAINKKEFLEKMGLKGKFDNEKNCDITRAEWENSIIEYGEIKGLLIDPNNPDASVLELDDHETHIITHSIRMKDPNVSVETRLKYLTHIEEHLTYLKTGIQAQGGGNMAEPQLNPDDVKMGQPEGGGQVV